MPCNSEYLRATWSETEASRLLLLMNEVKTGQHVDAHSREWAGYHPDAYGSKQLSDGQRDAVVRFLCNYCGSHDIRGHSLELQVWWRDHQKADQQRLENEAAIELEKRQKEDRILAEAEAIQKRRSSQP